MIAYVGYIETKGMEMMPALITYKHYMIASRASGEVAVFVDLRDPALYKTDSIKDAKAWVDAYRAGRMWAIDAKLNA